MYSLYVITSFQGDKDILFQNLEGRAISFHLIILKNLLAVKKEGLVSPLQWCLCLSKARRWHWPPASFFIHLQHHPLVSDA